MSSTDEMTDRTRYFNTYRYIKCSEISVFGPTIDEEFPDSKVTSILLQTGEDYMIYCSTEEFINLLEEAITDNIWVKFKES